MAKKRSIFLYPFSLLYGFVTAVKNFLYNSGILKSFEFSIPVICVGNISVGGTGKTPHTEYLAGMLSRHFKVAVLSRGFKRKSPGFLYAEPDSLVEEIGDEPKQISGKYPGIIVAVDRNRVNGIKKILEDYPETEVIVLDDAFQHRRLQPGFSILLSDFGRLIIEDSMLPYGNLREHAHNMNRADIILITKSPQDISAIQRRLIVKQINKAPYQNLYFTALTYLPPVPLFGEGTPAEDLFKPDERSKTGILLITGIANPGLLYEYLKNKAGEIVHLRFKDHHRFDNKDNEKIYSAWNSIKSSVKYVITTEKDAVRLREFINIAEPDRSLFYYLPVEINFLNDDKEEFDNIIVEYVRKNKRNNRISQV